MRTREQRNDETITSAERTRGYTVGTVDNAFRKIITVPKEAFVKEEARLKKLREKKRAKKV